MLIVIDAIVDSACVVAVVVLYRRFKTHSSSSFHALVAAAALTLGLLIGLAGVGHTVAVVGVALSHRAPYDFRLAWLLVTGLVLIYSGAVNVAASRWIKRGSLWALSMSAAATLLLLSFVSVLYPLRQDTDLLVIYGLLLGLVIAALVLQLSNRAGAT